MCEEWCCHGEEKAWGMVSMYGKTLREDGARCFRVIPCERRRDSGQS